MDFTSDRDFWIAVVGMPLLALLLTGPGMWSEHWGWGTLDKLFTRKKKRAEASGAGADETSQQG